MLNDREFLRYSRQLLLEDVGPEGQEKLKRATVLIVGLGGWGPRLRCIWPPPASARCCWPMTTRCTSPTCSGKSCTAAPIPPPARRRWRNAICRR